MYENYTVKKGDSLYSIAKQFNTSVPELTSLNNLTSNTLSIGQVLRIPTTSTSNTYTVKKGDSLYSIAKQFNTSVSELTILNNLKSNALSIGQVLKVPSTTTSTDTLDGYTTYTVKSGDTLYGISNQFGVSANDLANLNNVNATTLQIGQILKIPTSSGTNPPAMFIYTVKSGDSLYKIAKLYETTVDAIIKLNNLKSNALSIGQQLRIPESGEMVTSKPSYSSYIVKKGDSLYSIAKKFGVSVDIIVKDNALKTNNLSIGQELKIRTPSTTEVVAEECFGEEYTPPTTGTIYTVKKGDSLYTIAQKFNTSVDSIKRKNNLTSNNLSIGQQLNI